MHKLLLVIAAVVFALAAGCATTPGSTGSGTYGGGYSQGNGGNGGY